MLLLLLLLLLQHKKKTKRPHAVFVQIKHIYANGINILKYNVSDLNYFFLYFVFLYLFIYVGNLHEALNMQR